MINITIQRAARTFTVNSSGRRGYPGKGVPSGGLTGQMLVKRTNTAYDTEWVDNNSIMGSLAFIYAIMFGD